MKINECKDIHPYMNECPCILCTWAVVHKMQGLIWILQNGRQRYWLSCLVCQKLAVAALYKYQSYEIKSPSWTILWFRILGIFSVENIKRLCVFMLQTWDNTQLLRRVLWISAELTIVSSLKHKNTQPLYIFNRVRVLHLDRLKERTWLHSFGLEYMNFLYSFTF